jgi:hypothetical protein
MLAAALAMLLVAVLSLAYGSYLGEALAAH